MNTIYHTNAQIIGHEITDIISCITQILPGVVGEFFVAMKVKLEKTRRIASRSR